jgi:hypothetical protein
MELTVIDLVNFYLMAFSSMAIFCLVFVALRFFFLLKREVS